MTDSIESKFEPDSGYVGDTEVEHAIASIAMSLKRIADAVAGDSRNSGIVHALFDMTRRD